MRNSLLPMPRTAASAASQPRIPCADPLRRPSRFFAPPRAPRRARPPRAPAPYNRNTAKPTFRHWTCRLSDDLRMGSGGAPCRAARRACASACRARGATPASPVSPLRPPRRAALRFFTVGLPSFPSGSLLREAKEWGRTTEAHAGGKCSRTFPQAPFGVSLRETRGSRPLHSRANGELREAVAQGARRRGGGLGTWRRPRGAWRASGRSGGRLRAGFRPLPRPAPCADPLRRPARSFAPPRVPRRARPPRAPAPYDRNTAKPTFRHWTLGLSDGVRIGSGGALVPCRGVYDTDSPPVHRASSFFAISLGATAWRRSA